MSRTIIVASPASNAGEKFQNETSKTWGEFRNKLGNLYNQSNMEAIMSPGNVTLKRDDAQLGDGNLTIFLIPTKNSSGSIQDVVNRINQLSKIATERDLKELEVELMEVVDDHFDHVIEPSMDTDVQKAIELGKMKFGF